MAHFNSSEQPMDFERGFVIDLDLQTGLSKMLDTGKRISGADEPACSQIRKAYDEIMKDGNPLVYEFHSMPVPETDGDLDFRLLHRESRKSRRRILFYQRAFSHDPGHRRSLLLPERAWIYDDGKPGRRLAGAGADRRKSGLCTKKVCAPQHQRKCGRTTHHLLCLPCGRGTRLRHH